MNYDDFLYLDYQEKRGNIILKLQNPLGDKITFLRGKDRSFLPLHLSFIKGRYFGDILTLGTIGIRGYSPRIIEIISKAGATGIEFFPLTIEGPESIVHALKGYHGAFITGTSGPIILEKSKFTLKSAKANSAIQIYYQSGRFFDLETWDGSDFFNPEGTLCTYLTSRISKIISAIKPALVSFTSIRDYNNIIPLSMIPNNAQIEHDSSN
jgi:hypothetical protein